MLQAEARPTFLAGFRTNPSTPQHHETISNVLYPTMRCHNLAWSGSQAHAACEIEEPREQLAALKSRAHIIVLRVRVREPVGVLLELDAIVAAQFSDDL